MLTVVFAENDEPVDSGRIDYSAPLPRLNSVADWQAFLSAPLVGCEFANLHEVLENMAARVAEELSNKDHKHQREIMIWVQHPDNPALFYQDPVMFELTRGGCN